MTVHSLSDWSPASSAVGIAPNAPVSVKVNTAGSAELDVDYTTGTALLTGTVSLVQVLGDTLELAPVSVEEDFEGDTVTAAPSDFTKLTTVGGLTVQDPSGTNQVCRGQIYNDACVYSWDSGPATADGEILARVQKPTGGVPGICLRLTGSGASLRGYLVRVTSTHLNLRRLTGDGSDAYVGDAAHGETISAGTWYWLRYRLEGSTHKAKLWEDGDSEPVAWQLTKTDSTHSGAGDSGIFCSGDTTSPSVYFDDFEGVELPSTYPASGTWTGPSDSLTSVGDYSHSRIAWTETKPTGTSVTVEARVDGGTWTAVTNGGELPDLSLDDDLTGSTLELRVTLATTDTDETPVVENLLAEFIPLQESEVELLIDGTSCTLANGRLRQQGDQEVSGGAVIQGYDRTFTSVGLFHHKTAGQSLTAELEYKGTSLGSISFSSTEFPDHREAGDLKFIFPLIGYHSGPADLAFRTYSTDNIYSGGDLVVRIVDKVLSLRGDLTFYVASGYESDFPGELIAAIPELTDHPGEVIVRGYATDDIPGALLAQGYRIDDIPGEVLAGVRAAFDFVGSLVAGVARSDDFPGEVIVYGVNRNNVLEVHVIDETTYQALLAEGVVFN